MQKASFHILRIGLGITFIIIGILIWRSPEFYGSFLQPWAADLVIGPLDKIMLSMAVLDIVIGLLFILNFLTWLAALIASIHVLIVIITIQPSDITVRDIGILAGTVALFSQTWNRTIWEKWLKR